MAELWKRNVWNYCNSLHKTPITRIRIASAQYVFNLTFRVNSSLTEKISNFAKFEVQIIVFPF